MRRFTFFTLTAVLALLVLARSLLPPPARYAMAETDGQAQNILSVDLSAAGQTAGGALIGEMNAYIRGRAPTEKNPYTGVLRGKNLILILAEDWDAGPESGSAALRRLRAEGSVFAQVYRPDWYQGRDGRVFALLSGLMPTSVRGTAALAYAGEQDIALPFAPARLFADAGYRTLAFLPDTDRQASYAALGFQDILPSVSGDPAGTETDLALCAEGGGLFFAFFLWDVPDGGAALDRLMEALDALSLEADTAVCLVTGGGDAREARILLRSRDYPAPEVDLPCSELDLAPTLENLFGLPFDSRFLSGRDLLAPVPDPAAADSLTPLVTLAGSAYADWITPAGRYDAARDSFTPAEGGPAGKAAEAYARSVCRLQYDRYVFARRVLEENYLRLIFGP